MTGYNPFFVDQAQQMPMQVQMPMQMQMQMPQQAPQQMPQQMSQQIPQQIPQQQNLTVNTMTVGAYGNNPFTRSPTRMASPLGQIPEQAQYVTSSPPVQQPAATNPFFAQPAMVSPVQTPFEWTPTGQPMMQSQQLPQKPDKASILALYNYPHLAPRPFMPDRQMAQAVDPTAHQLLDAQQPRSIPPTALPGSKNPFLNGSGTTSPSAAPAMGYTGVFPTTNGNHGSRESVQLGMEMATWANGGRHSPDAFASLSAKHV
jgi:hypothetical protein